MKEKINYTDIFGNPDEFDLGEIEKMQKFLEQKMKESKDESILKFRDPNFLPTREEIIESFTDYFQWSEFCSDHEKPVFEFLNEDFLDAFADYFVDKIKEYNINKEKPLMVLEIGAGNGRLTHFLQEKLEQKAPGQVKVIATDSGGWGIKSDFPVEQLEHVEAMEKYKPDIVIFSWMPYKEDSTKDIRKIDSVKEYILIGEKNYGCCGDPWETWGTPWNSNEYNTNEIPLYKKDGFEKEELKNLSKLQICRTDRMPGHDNNSATVSFKRKK